MAEAANSREARRRKRILQQGSDRLAFIKGQIQSLPSSDLLHGKEEAEHSNPVLENHVPSERTITQTPPLHEKQHTQNEISTVPTSEIQPEPENLQLHSQPQPQPDLSNEIFQQQPEEPRSFNFIIPSDVTNAIDASSITRLCCSIFMALLVVASYLGFSLIKSVISFKPLYLVLLTNLTIVVSRLISGKQRGFDDRSRRRQNSDDSSDQWGGQLAKTLEIGMVVKSVVDAVFMDCAVYAIVLICSLSLLRS
ncbi:uncharacterized protein [Cicer arietinum]|uniref:Uncharacterized protein LOC101508434 n=1 Tax=Cicer arietinum TaxID=3827 RepID=A0A1S2Z3L5_CICAR|nr:uncharacterized protein LOC101508434 [Cicer arietinum]XP_004514458.1 uncharacterized protein LOC101508434 [Cicer arietinum]XP_004514459.1 uncharacterized protein LOC101508434 [Cicer arietinum]